MENYPLVCLIILCWNGKKWIDPCLSTVLATEYPNFKAVVVDNGSSDGSREYIKEHFPQVELLANKKNLGFAEGNNVGIRHALSMGAKYIVLLNQDIKVEPSWLSELIATAEKDSNIGILSPIQYDYEGREIDYNFLALLNTNSKFREDYKLNKVENNYELHRVIGAAMMISKKVLNEIGLLDHLYFCYHEETDFCRKALYHNYKIVCVAKSVVYHWHGLLDNKSMTGKKSFLLLRNFFLYILKNPYNPFWKNLLISYPWGAWHTIIKSGSLTDLKYHLKILYIQVWIFIHLPLIALSHYRDRTINNQA